MISWWYRASINVRVFSKLEKIKIYKINSNRRNSIKLKKKKSFISLYIYYTYHVDLIIRKYMMCVCVFFSSSFLQDGPTASAHTIIHHLIRGVFAVASRSVVVIDNNVWSLSGGVGRGSRWRRFKVIMTTGRKTLRYLLTLDAPTTVFRESIITTNGRLVVVVVAVVGVVILLLLLILLLLRVSSVLLLLWLM